MSGAGSGEQIRGGRAVDVDDAFQAVVEFENGAAGTLEASRLPPGHTIGWEHTFVHELHHLLSAIARDEPVGPHGADFEDGYRAAAVCEAILRSAASGSRQQLEFAR